MSLNIKQNIVFFLLFLVFSSAFGQLKTGVIVFERKTNLLKKYPKEETKKWLNGKKMKIDNFELHFTPTQSFFVPVKVPDEGRMGWLTIKNTVYQDLKNAPDRCARFAAASCLRRASGNRATGSPAARGAWRCAPRAEACRPRGCPARRLPGD